MVFVIFKGNVDYYWARSRVIERMNVAQQRLPTGVVPVIGPDATALGQIFWYTVEGEGFDLAELRSIQDWYIRYQLNAVEGVSEVASIGGFVKQYQIDVHRINCAHRVAHGRDDGGAGEH
jgi:Cu(I)/Ag(I) efflux system membrane protein CusA/SilA